MAAYTTLGNGGELVGCATSASGQVITDEMLVRAVEALNRYDPPPTYINRYQQYILDRFQSPLDMQTIKLIKLYKWYKSGGKSK